MGAGNHMIDGNQDDAFKRSLDGGEYPHEIEKPCMYCEQEPCICDDIIEETEGSMKAITYIIIAIIIGLLGFGKFIFTYLKK